MKLDKEDLTGDIDDISTDTLANLRDEMAKLSDGEVERRELLKSLDAKVQTVVRLKRENDNLVTSIKKNLSNL